MYIYYYIFIIGLILPFEINYNTKYLFVTGGVLSSLGKGLTAASIATLLELQGYKIKMQKCDPYLNIDSGTLSPYEHGECYVLQDGKEVDLDFGSYYRLTQNIEFDKLCSITSGQIYQQVLNNEREGKYLGHTVQVIPHITNEIIRRMTQYDGQCDIVITEIGGTVGDIESIPFQESIRQLCIQKQVCLVHISLVPYIRAAQESKTKPTQSSVSKLREIGLQPDLIGLRSEVQLDESVLQKIAFYSSLKQECVFSLQDISNIYLLPVALHKQNIEKVILNKLQLQYKDNIDMNRFQRLQSFMELKQENKLKIVKVGVCGKYIELQDSYKSVYESIHIAGMQLNLNTQIVRINSEDIKSVDDFKKEQFQAQCYIVPGGYGSRGIDGMKLCIRYCRENNVPFLGICLGMQLSCIEFFENVVKLDDCNSQEMKENCKNPIIHYMEGQEHIKQLGGTNRLGNYQCDICDPFVEQIYGKQTIQERHRHRLEFNNEYEKYLGDELIVSGIHKLQDNKLVEMIRNKKCKYFIGAQFHPELSTRVGVANPLFRELINAANQ